MIDELRAIMTAMEQNVFYVLAGLALLFAINILNWMMGSWLNFFGLLPRTLRGIIGIFVSPVLHGDFNHLFFNSVPLFVFANLILLYGLPAFYCVTTIVVLLSGAIVWLVGRRAIHIGASGVVMGYWSYLLINAIEQRTAMALILGAVSIYYFGGLVMSLFSDDADVSLEGHAGGFVAGIAAYYLCQNEQVIAQIQSWMDLF